MKNVSIPNAAETLWQCQNVNMDHVVAVDEHDFLLEDGSRVPVSRNGRRLILQRYQDYQFEKQERRGCVG